MFGRQLLNEKLKFLTPNCAENIIPTSSPDIQWPLVIYSYCRAADKDAAHGIMCVVNNAYDILSDSYVGNAIHIMIITGICAKRMMTQWLAKLTKNQCMWLTKSYAAGDIVIDNGVLTFSIGPKRTNSTWPKRPS